MLGALILMPVLLGMPAFAALKDPMMRADAWGSRTLSQFRGNRNVILVFYRGHW